MNLDRLFIHFLFGGVVVSILAQIVLIVQGFRQSRGWGLAALLFGPFAGLAFTLKHFRQALPWLGLAVIGLTLVGLAYYPAIFGEGVSKDPVVRNEKGDVQLTITSAENFDYSTLNQYPHLSMLQMANSDVNDATMAHLKVMSKLKNLDISNTNITDAGLTVLRELPELAELRLANTKITDQGFRTHLMDLEKLKRLDLTGTAVSNATIDEWKKAQPGRRALK